MPSVGETLSAAVLLGGAVVALCAGAAASARRRIVAGGLGSAGAIVGAALATWAHPALPLPSRPASTTQPAYVGSAACRGCHPSEWHSFRATFHRTMTQDASPETVLAPLDGRPLIRDGAVEATSRLERRGTTIVATLPDPAVLAARVLGAIGPDAPVPIVERPVVLTTGSHREQAYWVPATREGELRLFPFVWLVREQRFVAREDAFVRPPDQPIAPARWNSNCVACHAVGGEPGHDLAQDTFTTRAAELGIACEACHGPGRAHADRHRDPFERWSATQHAAPDPTIVHPGRLAADRSAAVCGQCHAYTFPRDSDTWWATGYARSFRPGDALAPTRHVLSLATFDPAASSVSAGQRPDSAPALGIDASGASLFWPDGAIRVGGREWNGLVASSCFTRGSDEKRTRISCLSCHAMHAGDPAGQIAPDRSGDRGCLSCHTSTRERSHGHHAAGSPGNACVACHMPKTSYALLSAVRSHTIDSPRPGLTAVTGKPNACNLCHLDRSLAWSADHLASWFGTRPDASGALPVGDAAADVARGLHEGLAGDAALRVLVADALGDPATPSVRAIATPILAEMLLDPYAAVRFVAVRSLARVGLCPVTVDASAPSPSRRGARDEVRACAAQHGQRLDPDVVARLLAERDDRAVTIAE